MQVFPYRQYLTVDKPWNMLTVHFGTSSRHSSQSVFGQSTGNNISGHYKHHYFAKLSPSPGPNQAGLTYLIISLIHLTPIYSNNAQFSGFVQNNCSDNFWFESWTNKKLWTQPVLGLPEPPVASDKTPSRHYTSFRNLPKNGIILFILNTERPPCGQEIWKTVWNIKFCKPIEFIILGGLLSLRGRLAFV